MEAYNKLERIGDGVVNINDMRLIYNPTFHPKYKAGEMNIEELLAEFM